jgi:hypothetical protein
LIVGSLSSAWCSMSLVMILRSRSRPSPSPCWANAEITITVVPMSRECCPNVRIDTSCSWSRGRPGDESPLPYSRLGNVGRFDNLTSLDRPAREAILLAPSELLVFRIGGPPCDNSPSCLCWRPSCSGPTAEPRRCPDSGFGRSSAPPAESDDSRGGRIWDVTHSSYTHGIFRGGRLSATRCAPAFPLRRAARSTGSS